MNMNNPTCNKCGKEMAPENARIHPEYFLHDKCLPDELQPEPQGERLQMKMAKASTQDLAAVASLLMELEEAIENRTYYLSNGDIELDSSDERLARLVRRLWPLASTSWRRVVYGCEMLINNCCDPNADTLEWRPDIAGFLSLKKEDL